MQITVLHTESSPGWGGQENRILNEAIGIRKLGINAYILCQPESKLAEKAKQAGIEVFTYPMRKTYDIKAIYYIIKLIKKLNIDVVNTHSGKDTYVAAVASRVSKTRPLVVRTRHLALPITSTFSYKYLADVIVTVSEYVREYLVKKGIDAKKIYAVPTGIDLHKFNPQITNGNLKKELGLSESTPLIGTIAVLRKKKGHHLLIEAIPRVLKKIPEAVFVFVGDGPQRNNIEKKIKEYGLSNNIVMLGYRDDIPQILKSIDLFVLPTLQEALGTSFIEAMAMCKPVIGSDVDGVREVIDDGVNGYLVHPDDIRALADRIIELITDRQKALIMGAKGREKVEKKYTIEKMCNEMLEIYLKNLKSPINKFRF